MTTELRSAEIELVEAWNSHDVDRVVALHGPLFKGLDVAAAGPVEGLDDLRSVFSEYLAAFPDLHVSIENAVRDGDQVAISWIGTGTHRGTLMNIPPTGRAVSVRGMSMLTFRDGSIVVGTCVWDVAGMLRGLGLLPELLPRRAQA